MHDPFSHSLIPVFRGRSGADVRDLASALASSPIWETMAPARLIVRHGRNPIIAAAGAFDEADHARLEFLARWLPDALESVRYVDYPAVTRAVTELAGHLRDHFDGDVHAFDLAAIPRGGLIVLGLLSYALGRDGDPMARSDDPDRPLVVVDDCALTGSRFKRFMAEHGDRKSVVFAHLASPRELRRAIEDQETAVSACLAAIDLQDLAPQRHGDAYAAWRIQVEQRVGQGRYWIGQTEDVAFPWNEPDHNFWNPVTETTEWGWTLIPPDRCLKNIRQAGSRRPEVVEFAPVRGQYEFAEGIVAGHTGSGLRVLEVDSGRMFGLEGTAVTIWEALVAAEPSTTIASSLSRTHDVPMDQAAEDVEAFMRQLEEAGIIRPANGEALER